MQTVMQMIVRPTDGPEAFAHQLSATLRAFKVSGAKRIQVLQLGDGSVAVIAFRTATADELADANDPDDDGPPYQPLLELVREPVSASLVLDLVLLARNVGVAAAEQSAIELTVECSKHWAPAMVRIVYDDIEGIVRNSIGKAGTERVASDTVRVLVAALAGLHLLRPPPNH